MITAAQFLRNENGEINIDNDDGSLFHIEIKELNIGEQDKLQFLVNNVPFHVELSTLSIDDKILLNSYTNGSDDDQGTINPLEKALQKQLNFSWTDASTKLFLALYKKKRDLVITRKIKNFKAMYKIIAEEMSKEGYIVTPLQAENKFKTMDRAYKGMISNNKKTGRAKKLCPYESELTELLGKKHNIVPLAISSNNGLQLKQDSAALINDFPSFQESVQSNVDVILPAPSIFCAFNEPSTSGQKDFSTPVTRQRDNKTSKALLQCQKAIDDYTHEIQEQGKVRQEIQENILEEYKKMIKIQEQFVKDTKEYRSAMIQQKQEYCDLLRRIHEDVKKILKNSSTN